jgi:hypothetical protein
MPSEIINQPTRAVPMTEAELKRKQADCEPAEPLYVRTISEVLTCHLERSGTSVHWAIPAGCEVSWGPPKLTWPKEPFLGYVIDERGCEGTIVTVVHHESARGSEHGQELIKIKFLRSLKAVLAEVVAVVEFLDSMNIDDILNLQMQNAKKGRH